MEWFNIKENLKFYYCKNGSKLVKTEEEMVGFIDVDMFIKIWVIVIFDGRF